MENKEQKRFITSQATQHDCQVLRIDLRSCYVRLRRGTAVWHIPFYRGITAHHLANRIRDGLVHGQRLDRDPKSSYFIAEQ